MNLENSKIDNQTAVVNKDNVVDFHSKLRKLREGVNPDLIRKRKKRNDGVIHTVDYVEWHTVADILDETVSNWNHSVKDIKQIGEILTITVAITIDGVTREGIGTGLAMSEMGIKKAEHDALKRAAVKFGIARALYRRESVETVMDVEVESPNETPFPSNPMAKSLSDLLTGKQLRMIRALSRELDINSNEECDKKMGCIADELSKKAASSFIDHLQDLKNNQRIETQAPMRRAG